MNKIKQVFLPISILVLFLSCFAVVQAEEVNPFSLEIIRIHGDEEQVQVYVKVDAAYGLSAFDFSINYDANVLQPYDKSEDGYAFSNEYQTGYTGGLLSCNKKTDGQVRFAGAKTGAQPYSGKMAYVCFRLLAQDVTSTNIQIQVNTVAKEQDNAIVRLDLDQPQKDYTAVLQSLEGDVNFDGKVSLDDAQLALKAALKIISFDENQVKAADINQSGAVDMTDAQSILKLALHIPL